MTYTVKHNGRSYSFSTEEAAQNFIKSIKFNGAMETINQSTDGKDKTANK